MSSKFKRELLEELIYDRVRTRLAIRELRAVDAELRKSIAETLRGVSKNRDERDTIALELLEKAWERVGAEEQPDSSSPEVSFRPAIVAA